MQAIRIEFFDPKQHIVYGSMTPREELRINGRLCDETIEALVDRLEDLENERVDVQETLDCIREAKAELQATVSMFEQVDELMMHLRGHVRGVNTPKVKELQAEIERVKKLYESSYTYVNSQLDYAVRELKHENKK